MNLTGTDPEFYIIILPVAEHMFPSNYTNKLCIVSVFMLYARMPWVTMEIGVFSPLWLAGLLEMPHHPLSRANP